MVCRVWGCLARNPCLSLRCLRACGDSWGAGDVTGNIRSGGHGAATTLAGAPCFTLAEGAVPRAAGFFSPASCVPACNFFSKTSCAALRALHGWKGLRTGIAWLGLAWAPYGIRCSACQPESALIRHW